MLEIGSGIGLSLEQARALYLAERVACIEPSPECCEQIRRDCLADEVWESTLDRCHVGARTGMRILPFESLGELDLELVCRAASNSADPAFGRFAAFLSQPGLARDVQRLFMQQGCTGFNHVILARHEALPA